MPVGWDDDPAVTGWPGLPPLDGDRSADACVIGLGGSGLAAVEELLGRGASVVAVDAGRVAEGAAGRNGGFMLGGGQAALHHAVGSLGDAAAVALYRATLAELERLAERLGPDVIRRVGSIRLAGLPGEPESDPESADRAAELDDCRLHAATLRAHGIAVEQYDGELGSGLFLPDDAATNPARRAIGLAGLLRERTSLHEHTPVTRVEAGRVVTERGVITASVVVVAVDGRLDVLLPRLAGRVRTARLQMLATEPLPSRVPCPVYCRWGYDYAQQDGDGVLYVGGGRDRFADSEWTTDDAPTEPVQRYIETVARRMAGRSVTPTRRWAASVGYTADGRPLCVEVDEGVVACGGYNGTGNLVGPLAARSAVALALDGTPPPPWFDADPL